LNQAGDHHCEPPVVHPVQRERLQAGGSTGTEVYHFERQGGFDARQLANAFQISFYISMTHSVSFSFLIATLQRDQKDNTRFWVRRQRENHGRLSRFEVTRRVRPTRFPWLASGTGVAKVIPFPN